MKKLQLSHCKTILAFFALLAFAAVAPAQTPVNPAPTTAVAKDPQAGLKRFSAFLDEHPQTADQLREHPALANDAAFLASHKELSEFLAAHPGVDKALATHPRFFIHHEIGFMRSKEITGEEVRTFDKFLDNHPEVGKQLATNPQLARDPKFVADHPEFRDFLKDHPKVSGALESKPGKMLKREATHEAREAAHGKK